VLTFFATIIVLFFGIRFLKKNVRISILKK